MVGRVYGMGRGNIGVELSLGHDDVSLGKHCITQ